MNTVNPVRFGILGVGRIARNAFAPAIAKAASATLVAAASRSIERAESVGARRAYDDYDALLSDPEVEAVYIATHNGLHCPLGLRALERGKHVLCEKPLARDAKECRRMIEAAAGRKLHLAEAFMYRHHPRWREVTSLLRGGAIGEPCTAEATFSFVLADRTDVRFTADWGGGAVFDVGCYCVNSCRVVFGGMPTSVVGLASFDPVSRVDMSLQGLLEFGSGQCGIVSCGFDRAYRDHVVVSGTEGTLEIPRAFGNSGLPTTLTVDTRAGRRELSFEPTDVFQSEIEDFARAIRGDGEPLLAPTDSLDNMRVIDALLRSARRHGAPITDL